MQRVAAELLTSLQHSDGMLLHVVAMRVSWRWIHFKIIPFLFTTYLKLLKLVRTERVDAILFSSMVTGLLTIPLRKILEDHNVRSSIMSRFP